MITDSRIVTAPAGSGGTGSGRVPAGATFSVMTVGMRPWTQQQGSDLPCAGLLGRSAGLAGRILPAAVPHVAVPATDVPATAQNAIQMFAGSPTTGTQHIGTQQISTTLGIHSPGRPQS